MIIAPGRLLTRRDQPHKSTHGWQARRYGRRGAVTSKFFSDRRWGGKDAAYLMAEEWVLKGRK